MGTRGPQSTAALSVIGSTGIEVVARPKAPDDLTDEQAVEWREIVNSHPADQFSRARHSMLADYCRHTVMARRVAQMVTTCENADVFDLDLYDRLGKMLDRESRCIASLAVRLGVAWSTAYEKRPAKGAGSTKKPWEFDGD